MRRARLLLVLSVSAMLAGCGAWRETYEKDEDIPYGLSVLPQVLKAAYEDAEYVELGRRAVRDGELLDADVSDLYIAASAGLSYSIDESDELADFVARGGTAVLIAKDISNKLAYHFAIDSCAFYRPMSVYGAADSLGKIATPFGDSLEWPLLTYELAPGQLSTTRLRRTVECYPEAKDLLAYRMHDPGYHSSDLATWAVSLPLGEGQLIWVSVPMMLTNVYTTDSAGQRAIDELFRVLPQSPSRVLYDVDRESSLAALSYENQPPMEIGSTGKSAALLSQVLGRPPLAAAWYLLLAGFLAFVIVGSKRRQRLVPLVHARRNTTHEHLGDISRLYLAKPDNPRMARKQLKLFEAYCTRRFGLQPLENEADAQRLREMQGVSAKDIDTILRYNRSAERNQLISNTGFVQLVHILQAFYRGVGRAYE